MTSTEASFGTTIVSPRRRRTSGLAATAIGDWSAARSRWQALASGPNVLPFQRTSWLDAWYGHCAEPGTEPLLVFVTDPLTGQDILGLPLVMFREGMKRVISFADRGLTDYNAPALGSSYVETIKQQEIWAAIRAALPAADLVRLEKMPTRIDDRGNPLAALPGATASTLIGNILHVPGTWDEWRQGLERTFRKELERSGRVFDKHPGAAFRRYDSGPEAERVYEALTRLQRERIAELKLPYILDDEPARGFYGALVRDGLRDGTAVLTALTIGDEVVAALLGITDGHHYAMTRLATPGPQWKNFSPGRMVIERTMKMLHAEGFRAFDFTIGDYSYKRRIGVTPVPMVEATFALGPLGWPELARIRLKAAAKRHPALVERVRAWRVRGGTPQTH